MSFRPFQKAVSRREAVVYTRAVRALAHKEGISADEALAKLFGYRTIDREKPWQARGFHPDRLREGRVSHIQIDDGMLYLDDEDVYDFKFDFPEHQERTRQTDMTVSLIDIAKPARRKVRVRQSVMTAHARGVADYHFDDFIELDHDDVFSDFSEDWEDLYSNDSVGHEQTYSSVLRGEIAGNPPHRTSIPD